MSNQDERNQAERILDHMEAMVQAAVSKMLATALTTSFAITTGDTATTVTGSDGFTYNLVTVWLDGDAQTPANKRAVQLPYGVAAPAANQKWEVKFSQGRGAPGLLNQRLA